MQDSLRNDSGYFSPEPKQFCAGFHPSVYQLEELILEGIAVHLLLKPDVLLEQNTAREWRLSTQHAVATVLPIRGP